MLWGLDRATFRKASTATGARVIKSGGIMSVGIDTNADGKIDTVLGMVPRRPKLLARLLRRLAGCIPATGLIRWVVRRVIRWFALCARPPLLSACVQICTAALALSELRSEVALACESGECSIEMQEGLQRTVLGVQATLEESVEAVVAQLDEDADGAVSLRELLQGGALQTTAKAAAATAAVGAVYEAAEGGFRLLDELTTSANDAMGKVLDSAQELFGTPPFLKSE